jgi:hypothetical protein
MDDAYEGKTVRLKPTCPMCQATMEPGYLLDRGESGGAIHQSEWAAGEPKRATRLIGGIKTRGIRRYAVSTLRCEACGFLALYAMTPLNDV